MRAREPLGATHHSGVLGLSSTGSRVPRGISTPAAWAGLAGLLITALLISLSAAHTALLLPQSLRQSLGGLAGAFGHVGLDIGLPGLIAVMVLMFLSYAVAMRAAKYLSRRAVLGSIAALNALVLVAPPLLSTDLFATSPTGGWAARTGSPGICTGPT